MVGARILLLGAALSLLRPCESVASVRPASEIGDSASVPTAPDPAPARAARGGVSAGSSADYRVGPSDVLRVEVLSEPTLTGDYAVTRTGTIVFPLLGEVSVRDKLPSQISTQLTEALGRDYLQDPKVSVSVKEYRSKSVTILGNVGQPGVHFLDHPTPLSELLSMADGGTPRLVNVRRGRIARIMRQADPETGVKAEQLTIDLYDLLVLGKQDSDILMRHGDIVFIAASESVHVVGEVKNPSAVPYEPGMTVRKAISIAGGVTKKGARSKAVITRVKDGKETRIDAKPDDLVEREDIVEVPISFW